MRMPFVVLGIFRVRDALYARGCGENETHYNIFIGQCDLYLHGYSIFVDYTRVISVPWVNSKILFILYC